LISANQLQHFHRFSLFHFCPFAIGLAGLLEDWLANEWGHHQQFAAAKYYRLAEKNGNKIIGNSWYVTSDFLSVLFMFVLFIFHVRIALGVSETGVNSRWHRRGSSDSSLASCSVIPRVFEHSYIRHVGLLWTILAAARRLQRCDALHMRCTKNPSTLFSFVSPYFSSFSVFFSSPTSKCHWHFRQNNSQSPTRWPATQHSGRAMQHALSIAQVLAECWPDMAFLVRPLTHVVVIVIMRLRELVRRQGL
jgi:hypothetical protein